MDRQTGAEFLAIGDAVGEVVLEIAALAVVGLHRHDIRAVGEQQDVFVILHLVGARAGPGGEEMHRLQLARVAGVQHRDAIGKHVAHVHMLAVDHHLHTVRPAPLVAIGDVPDAATDALRRRRLVGPGVSRAGRERRGGNGRHAEQAFQMIAAGHVCHVFSWRPEGLLSLVSGSIVRGQSAQSAFAPEALTIGTQRATSTLFISTICSGVLPMML